MKIKLQMTKNSPQPTRGQSLVEFELALVIMVFLMLAVADFGLAFFSWIGLRDAAQEGATYASVAPPVDSLSTAAIKARVKNASAAPVNLKNLADDKIEVQMVGTNPKACPGYEVHVKVTYDYHVISPWIVGKTAIPISASVTDTILQPGNGILCQ